MAPLEVEWLGRVPYAAGLEVQARAVEARRAVTGAGDRLLLLEHPSVVTLGRSWKAENLLESRESLEARGVEVHEIPRGGDVTWHGPGQLVGYPIVDLTPRGRDVHRFLRDCEEALIEALAALGIRTRRIDGKTGVFVDRGSEAGAERGLERKIASIGVGVRRWVTCHGFALNVTTDLAGFDAIVPCGLTGVEMTSVARELEASQRSSAEATQLGEAVRAEVAAAFRRTFA